VPASDSTITSIGDDEEFSLAKTTKDNSDYDFLAPLSVSPPSSSSTNKPV